MFKIDDYIPDAWRPKYNDYKKTFVDALIRTGIIYAPSASSSSDRPGECRPYIPILHR